MSAFDAAAVEDALRDARAEVVIDELTSLPKDPSRMAETDAENHKLRLEGGGNLHRAARACGVRRYIQQASGFFLEAGDGLAESPWAWRSTPARESPCTPGLSPNWRSVLNEGEMEGVALRYGFFYGPGTWYDPDGASRRSGPQAGAPRHRRRRGRLVVDSHR